MCLKLLLSGTIGIGGDVYMPTTRMTVTEVSEPCIVTMIGSIAVVFVTPLLGYLRIE